MTGLLRACARLLPLALLTACAAKPPVVVSQTLQPAAGAPAAYLVGSIGPLGRDAAYTNQRILLRKRGVADGAAAWWGHIDVAHTPKDIEDTHGRDKDAPKGEASVFVMPLKPGDYEFYDIQFFWNTGNGGFRSVQAREQFLVPMHLEPGKAYYIGEFRSRCLTTTVCVFFHGNQQLRDEPIARGYSPQLPALQALELNLAPAFPFVVDTARPAVTSDAAHSKERTQ